MEAATKDFDTFAWQVLKSLHQGVALDWTDIRIYVVIIVASLAGSALGVYIMSFFSKRGEIAAVRKDLDKITKIQEEIKAEISTRAWIEQNWWGLKRDTYWKLTQALNAMSDGLWNLLHYAFRPDKSPIKDSAICGPLVSKLNNAIDEYLRLTGISHIVLCDDAIEVIKNLSKGIKNIREKPNGSKAGYDDIEEIGNTVNGAYDRIIEVARRDLQGKV